MTTHEPGGTPGTALPTIREVERWDREHRRECQEYSCTLPHRMLAFADWYIVIAHEMEQRVRAEAARSERERLAEQVKTAFDEYLWGLSISPQPASGPCEDSVRYFSTAVLALIDPDRT